MNVFLRLSVWFLTFGLICNGTAWAQGSTVVRFVITSLSPTSICAGQSINFDYYLEPSGPVNIKITNVKLKAENNTLIEVASFTTTSKSVTAIMPLVGSTATYKVIIEGEIERRGITLYVEGISSETITVKQKPSKPGVSDLDICQANSPKTLSATKETNATLQWYDSSKNKIGTPSTPTSATTTAYYVTQTLDGCTSDEARLDVRVRVTPAPPITAPRSLTVCYKGTFTLPDSLKGSSVNWFDSNRQPLVGAPNPSTSVNTTTSYDYYVGQTLNGCPSLTQTKVTFTVLAPPAPVATPTSLTTCRDGSFEPVTVTGENIQWYDKNKKPISGKPSPSTSVSVNTTYTYSVGQTVSGCPSPTQTTVTYTVRTYSSVVTTPTILPTCRNSYFSVPAIGGSNLKWYANQYATTGEKVYLPEDFKKLLATSRATNNTTFFVSQTENNKCESPRTAVQFTVKDLPNPPIASPATLTACQNGTFSLPVSLTATNVKWYKSESDTTALRQAPAPLTTVANSRETYYVTQTLNDCESIKVAVTFVVQAAPNPPANTPTSILTCLNGTFTLPTELSNSAVRWYTNPTTTAGESVSTKPTYPSSSTPNSITYYASQTAINGCESNRQAVTFTVRDSSTAPVATPASVTACQNSSFTLPSLGSGKNIRWYTNAKATTGESYTTTLSPPTSAATTMTFYVSQTEDNKCESPRTAVRFIVRAQPSPPIASAVLITACQNTSFATLPAPLTDSSVKWYKTQTGGDPLDKAPQPATTEANSVQVFYAGKTDASGCESPRMAVSFMVQKKPAEPVVNADLLTACLNATPKLLSATGQNLKWYNATGEPLTSPAQPTSTVGNTSYSVTQTVEGCTSSPASFTISVKELPGRPTVGTTPVYCLGATNAVPLSATTTVSGASLRWYDANGSLLARAPTPPTSVAGTFSYSVSQVASTCEGQKATVSYTIRPISPKPTVTATISYCQNTTAVSPLTATGQNLKWYDAKKTLLSADDLKPSVQTAGKTTYYVTQTVDASCESESAQTDVLVIAQPEAPTPNNVIYCQGVKPSPLTASASGNLRWYDADGKLLPQAPTPSTTASSRYFVSQVIDGCESARALLTVTVNQIPTAPTPPAVSVSYCQNAPATALTTTVPNAKWYDAANNPLSTAPTPPTNGLGPITYYLTQTDANNCESNKAPVTVTINSLPNAPVAAAVTYCQDAPTVPLTANGNGTLKWYDADNNALPGSPKPSSSDPGVVTYSVSVVDANQCESRQTPVTITIKATPDAPVPVPNNPVCQNTGAVNLLAAGQNLKWFANETTTASLGSSVSQSTAQAGSFTYFVSQTVNGCESPRASIQLIVNAQPAAPDVSDQTGCQDVPAQPLTVSGTALQWYDGNDNQISPPSPTTNVEVTQVYRYKVTQTLNGCTSSKAAFTYTVNVTSPPTVTSPVGYCQNAPAKSLQATGANLTWTDPSGGVTTAAPIPSTATPTANASYSVTQTNAATGCKSREAEIKVIVNALPTASLEGATTVNLGYPAPLTLTLTGTGPYTYTLSDGTTGTVESAANEGTTVRTITVTPSKTTTYSITAITNACGSGTATGSALVTVNAPAITTGAFTSPVVCAGAAFSVPFTTTGEFTAGNSFIVEIASATGDSSQYIPISSGVVQGPIIALIPKTVAAGQYRVRVRATNSAFPVTGTVSPTLLTVKGAAILTFSARKKVIYKGEMVDLFFTLTGDAPWEINYWEGSRLKAINTSDNLLSVQVKPSETTMYKIKSFSNGCGEGKIEGPDTLTIQVSPLLGEPDPLVHAVSVYPVPTAGTVTVDIDLPLQKEPARLRLSDLNGRITSEQTTRQRQTSLSLENQPAGFYQLLIQVGNRTTVRRILKR